VSRLARLEKAVERQGEQVERLEDLIQEIVLTAESLRREIARVDGRTEHPHSETSREGGAER
jgi:predicted RNase H-like nuclease (RuvC/YqgF family)